MSQNAVFVILILNFITGLLALNGERQLLKDLFQNYSTEARPVENNHDPVELKLGIELNQLVNLEEKSESLSVFIFIRQHWHDPSLKWDPVDYNNVTTINISPHKIWLPDIVLENNVERSHSFGGSLDTLKNRVILSYDGQVKWLTPALLTSKCPINIEYFPFDRQVCELVFLSWTHSGLQIDLKEKELSTDSYSNHSEWYLENASVYRKEVFYSCCPDTPFPVVHFKLVLKRRPLFYLMNLILPIVVISMLTMLTFYLPAESGERISFGVTIFLSLTVFMLIVDELIPATSDSVPLVIVFFTSIMLEMVVLLIVMCYILRLYLKSPDDGPMPKWMRTHVYENLSFKLGIRRKDTKGAHHVTPHKHSNGTFEMETMEKHKEQEIAPHWPPNPYDMARALVKRNENGKSAGKFERPAKEGMYQLDSVLLQKIDTIIQRFDKEDADSDRVNEWRICALTIDRLAMIIFFVMFLATILGCFLGAP